MKWPWTLFYFVCLKDDVYSWLELWESDCIKILFNEWKLFKEHVKITVFMRCTNIIRNRSGKEWQKKYGSRMGLYLKFWLEKFGAKKSDVKENLLNISLTKMNKVSEWSHHLLVAIHQDHRVQGESLIQWWIYQISQNYWM